ncbi:MAG: alpha/beta hydrolase [Verrucomicrobiota bacterium]
MSIRTILIRALRSITTIFALVLLIVGVFQRKFLYHPTHEAETNGLKPWLLGNSTIGFCREVPAPKSVWLLIHGNAGQAADREYALPAFGEKDSIFLLEYPGYGNREGSPSLKSINGAAKQAYEDLRGRFPGIPVCVAGESIGTGAASFLAGGAIPPDKIVLIVPFDVLAHVASTHLPFLPVALLLLDNWNNIAALKAYAGPVEIFAAKDDEVIPSKLARNLAASKPSAVFHAIAGGHNQWTMGNQVKIQYP